jgi:hypothetical protein
MNNDFNRSNPIKNTSGGGHSAARYTGTHGHIQRSAYWCFIPGEGWVKWKELYDQVDAAFQDWQMRHALGLRRKR